MDNYITPPETYSLGKESSSPEEMHGMKSFSYSNECSMDLHASPFHLSALSLRILNSDIVAVGSVVPALTLTIPKGTIFYNDADDFGDRTNLRYKIFMYIDPEDHQLRIDFNRSTNEHFENDDFGNIASAKYFDTYYGADLKKVAERLKTTSDYPDLVFKGEIPSGFPQELTEALFGVLTFENTSEATS